MRVENNFRKLYILISITSILQVSPFFVAGATENNNSSDHGILSKIIPNCVFGVDCIGFILYTRDTLQGRNVDINDTKTNELTICPTLQRNVQPSIVFLIHGFLSEANNSNYFKLATDLVEKNITTISVDWADAACSRGGLSITDTLAYPSAVSNVPDVGKGVAEFAMALTSQCSIGVSDITFIGHSLGAHVAGFAAKHIKNMTEEVVQLIEALDPAAPGFAGTNCSRRLCDGDARVVRTWRTSVLGMLIGRLNFIFNNGLTQPECVEISCSHSRSVTYCTENVNGNCFRGIRTITNPFVPNCPTSLDQCINQTCVTLSSKWPIQPATGTYCVPTARKYPYCNINT